MQFRWIILKSESTQFAFELMGSCGKENETRRRNMRDEEVINNKT